MFLKRKIKKELYNYRHRYQELDWIISYLERNRLEYGVLGGFCLSVLKNTTANDIDIIVDDEIESLKRMVKEYSLNYSINDYGSIKIKTKGGFTIDLWTLKDHVIQTSTLKEVIYTIDLSLSAIMYTPKRLYTCKRFFSDFKNKTISYNNFYTIDENTIVRLIDFVAEGYSPTTEMINVIKQTEIDFKNACNRYRKKYSKIVSRNTEAFLNLLGYV